ncbi:putative CoA-substrate-specific enzyme activase [Halanaerobium congolense]|jgi:predicted CoA-substrate-specific enzyme activase|uniref:Putative CoA-substrate-specific enzyme activase n=1 Tax=Halanaerobium congolense TaxID=54121 RepID=A0A1M7L8Q6_9FIRM|nr:acyl-CoA dehydratase activase [Halanaerobium congolense]PXV63244.1 putative CoA-substrate-specific enzyme activase [Halanaerobium congolense]SHM74441.1 CoA-substrate-specific enzyme activase, putative [Halanaerobium congolense]
MNNLYLGVDIGSVSINIVAIDEENELVFKLYTRNSGNPIELVKEGLAKFREEIELEDYKISGVGVTGSGRQLIAYVLGADTVKNEITAHARASTYYHPEAGTIFEIGGQDSKLIIVEDGIAVDFAMNTVCAAGTGSFLDHQAERLGVPIEEFGGLALEADRDVRIAGRCTVFAESDMISKQQYGFTKPEIINGLSEALVRNYMNNLVRNRVLEGEYIFQGGVAANIGIKAAFEEEIGAEVIVPEHHDVMGAIGIAMLAKRDVKRSGQESSFRGFDLTEQEFETTSFECEDCANNCEVIKVIADSKVIAVTGDRCGKWTASLIGDSAANANVEGSSEKEEKTAAKSSKKQDEDLNKNSEELEANLYKVDLEKEKQVMKELEELEKSDENKKEDNSFV